MAARILDLGPKARRAIILVLVTGVPLLFLRAALDPFNVPKFSFLTAGVAVVAAIAAVEIAAGADPTRLHRIWVPAAAIVIPLALSWLFADDRGYSLFGWYGRLQGLVPYLVVVSLGVLIAFTFKDRARALLIAIGLAAVGVAVYAVIQYLQADPLGWVLGGRKTPDAVSTLGNPNFTGGFLGMTLPVVIVLWVRQRRFRKPWGFALIAIAGGLLYTGSQGGWAAGAAGLATVSGFLAVDRIRNARRWGLVLAGAVALASVGIAVLGTFGVRAVPGTATQRAYWWGAAAEMALDSPIVGHGPNQFALDGVRYRHAGQSIRSGYAFPDDPHSVPFSFLANAGLIGLAGFSIAALWALRTGMRLDDHNLEGAAFFSLTVAYFVQSLVSIDELSLRLMLWIGLAGLAIAADLPGRVTKKKRRYEAEEPTRSARRPHVWVPAALAALVVVGAAGWWSYRFLDADMHANRGVDALARGDVDRGLERFERTFELSSAAEYRRLYSAQLSTMASNSGRPMFYVLANEGFARLGDWPEVRAIVEHARLESAWGSRREEAGRDSVALYERAMAIDPLNPAIQIEFANQLLEIGDDERARGILEDLAPRIGHRYPEFWGLLAEVRAGVGDIEGALQAIEKALAIEPGNRRAQLLRAQLRRS